MSSVASMMALTSLLSGGGGALTFTADILLVAGGGGGGADAGGGGGGGGVLHLTSQTISSNITISVGAGGAGATGAVVNNGGNSSITGTGINETALGGGGGGSANNATGGTGGSGGGGRRLATAGAGTSGQGFAGENGVTDWGGGGGGAGEAGGTDASGEGGDGTSVNITGSAVIYGGGGGGGDDAVNNRTHTGGTGGGGTGGGRSSSYPATAGTDGRGGGGGGGGWIQNGADGGDGAVILRLPHYITVTQTSGSLTVPTPVAIGTNEHYYEFTGGGTSGTLEFSIYVADGIYNYTAIAEDGSGDGAYAAPLPSATTLSSTDIAQPGTLTSMNGTGKDRYIVLIAGSQNSLDDDTPNPYAELAGVAMTRAALDYGTATYYNCVDLHYVKYNDAGTPTLEWRKTNGGTCTLFALATAVFSFEVPAGATFTVNTSEGQGDGINETYTLDNSGKPRMVFVAMHKGNNAQSQTITENGASIVEFSGDSGTDENYAFGAEDEANITASTIAYSQVQVPSANTRQAEIVVEFVQQTPT